jgi:glycosyltransferase involved in cell wall biosynthesis
MRGISHSTRDDFQRFYGFPESQVLVDFPFNLPDLEELNTTWSETRARTPILAVNALDFRKSIDHIINGMIELSRDVDIELILLGRERMVGSDVSRLLGRLEDGGVQCAWYRSASDALLQSMYVSCGVLIFPSLYEGLGLPVLEAQSAGLPVITSSISSCREVNLNPRLIVDEIDGSCLANGMRRVIERDPQVLHGKELRNATREWLSQNDGSCFNRADFVLNRS